MDNFRLSERLKMVAGLIHQGNVVADIGTDHGYLPVYIVKQHISEHVIGMDLRKGPLQKAQHNIKLYNADSNIELRLSDGLDKLNNNEAQTITICGMGGKLIQRILTSGKDKFNSTTQLIVSPQSEIEEFRAFLDSEGYVVVSEHMLKEDGQYYLIINCHIGDNLSEKVMAAKKYNMAECNISDNEEIYDNITRSRTYNRYGRILLESKDACLYEYLIKEKKLNENIYNTVTTLEPNERIKTRLSQLEDDKKCIEYALSFYKE